MSTLVFDTETTGLPRWNHPSADPDQPHLVQIAMLLLADDGTETQSNCLIIRPDGWTIPPEMTAIHGISQEQAMDEGVPETEAVALFVFRQGQASLRVAHNEAFDRRVLRIAMTRAGLARDFIEAIEARASYCTCNNAKAIVNLPPTLRMLDSGRKGPKPPKLEECCRFFFGHEFVGAHDALNDARMCARVWQALTRRSATA